MKGTSKRSTSKQSTSKQSTSKQSTSKRSTSKRSTPTRADEADRTAQTSKAESHLKEEALGNGEAFEGAKTGDVVETTEILKVPVSETSKLRVPKSRVLTSELPESELPKLELPNSELAILVERAQAGEETALLELLHRFAPLLASWHWRLRQQMPHEEPEVVLSQVRFTFLILVEEFDTERGVPFPGFISVMLESRLRDFLRREKARGWLLLIETVSGSGLKKESSSYCAVCQAAGFSLAVSITSGLCRVTEDVPVWLWWREARSSLSQRQRQVMDLVLRGHTEREIAKALGIRQATVNETKKAAQKKLQKKWNE